MGRVCQGLLPKRSRSKYALDSICLKRHNVIVKWVVLFHEDFDPEFNALSEDVQDELLAHASMLQTFGPALGRPWVGTLKGSHHAKERTEV
jgi:hypothetical protein